jgi:hypothetical protein
MGQQPNIELADAEKPRWVLDTAPSTGWRADKPGIPQGPGDVARGGAFGLIGPDPGWAWKVVDGHTLPDDDPRLRPLVVGLVMARAAAFGRAAVPEDVEAALAICGYGEDARPGLEEQRERWLDATSHDSRPGATALSEVDLKLLMDKPERIRWAGRHTEIG